MKTAITRARESCRPVNPILHCSPFSNLTTFPSPPQLEFPLIILGVNVYFLKPSIAKLVSRIVLNMHVITTGGPSSCPKGCIFQLISAVAQALGKSVPDLLRVPTMLKQSLCRLQERSRLKLPLEIIKCDLISLGVSPKRSFRLSYVCIKFNEKTSFWGLMLCMKTLSQRQSCVSVSQSVCLRTRRHVTDLREFFNLAGRLGLSNSKLFRRPLFASSVLLSLCIKLQPFSLCWEILKSFPS